MKKSILFLMISSFIVQAAQLKKQHEQPPHLIHQTALKAVLAGDSATVKKLLYDGTLHLDDTDEYGNSMLHLAAMQNKRELAELLLKAGIPVDVRNKYGQTPLIRAAQNGSFDVAQLLLNNDAEIDAQEQHGMTALAIAAAFKHAHLVKLLVAAGANPEQKDADDTQARCFIGLRKDLAKAVIAGFAKDYPEKVGSNTINEMQQALAAGKKAHAIREKVCEFMGKNNPDGIRKLIPELDRDLINLQINSKFLLLWAIAHGYRDIVLKMIGAGADVNMHGYDGITPLIAAVNSNHEKIVQLLIVAHADVNASDNSGNTPLMFAVLENATGIMQLLVNAEAQLNAKNENQATALALAVSVGATQSAEYLLDHGADPNNEDVERFTPLMWAIANKKGLLAAKLARKGANINAHNSFGITPLMIAAKIHAPEIIKLLAHLGADTSAHDKDGHTLFDYIEEPGRKAVIEKAIQEGMQTTVARGKVGQLLIKNNKVSPTTSEEKMGEEQKQASK
jgi:ankyrin repeat protein